MIGYCSVVCSKKKSDSRSSSSSKKKEKKTRKSATAVETASKREKVLKAEPVKAEVAHETTDTPMPDSSVNQSQVDESEDSINPFKKYLNEKNENMLSEEIQEILKKPITVPKLPNYYKQLSLQKLSSS